MQAPETDWQRRLREHVTRRGLRMTEQRIAIAEVFFEQTGHKNVEELFEVVRQRKPGIGFATVYRTIKLLSECGLAEARNFGDGSTRFEPNLGDEHHDHLICVECGHIVEFENEEIEKLQVAVAESLGFVLTDHKMELYAQCVEMRRGQPCSRRKPR